MLHISLFSGIGGFDYASELVGWKNIVSCEINEFANRVLEFYWPEAYHHKDIHTLNYETINAELSKRYGKDWRNEDIVLTGGFPCFAAGTLVMTNAGLKPIEDIRVGDMILTKEGTYSKCNATMTKPDAPIWKIWVQGIPSLETTMEHPFWVRKKIHSEASNNDQIWGNPEWVEVKDIQPGDRVGFRVYSRNTESSPEAFWFIVGRYLALGHIDNKSVRISLPNGKDQKLIEAIETAGLPFIESHKSVLIKDKQLIKFLQTFGKNDDRIFNPLCHEQPDECKRALFLGWSDFDESDGQGSIRITTTNKLLAYGMAQIGRDAFKKPIQINQYIVNGKAFYPISLDKSNTESSYEDGFIWCNVNKVEQTNQAKQVYNIGVYESETYTANGITVHNCQPYSLAGKRLGKDDERHLFPEMLRVIREVRPKWIVGENVFGLVNWNNGLVFNEVQTDLENEGYEVQSYVLPAAGVGAPHKRDRIFIIAYSAEYGHKNGCTETGGKNGCSEPRGMQQFEGMGGERTAPDTENDRCGGGSDQECSNGERELLSREQSRSAVGGEIEGCGREWNATDIRSGDAEQRKPRFERQSWENFPTQSPICDRNDELSSRLVDITFSKWRQEAIKAMGNAVVPTLILQIFKAIQQYNDLEKENA